MEATKTATYFLIIFSDFHLLSIAFKIIFDCELLAPSQRANEAHAAKQLEEEHEKQKAFCPKVSESCLLSVR